MRYNRLNYKFIKKRVNTSHFCFMNLVLKPVFNKLQFYEIRELLIFQVPWNLEHRSCTFQCLIYLLTTSLTNKSSIIHVRGSLVTLQVRTLTESSTTCFTLEGALASVYPLMVQDLSSTSKCFATCTANKWLVTSVYNCMNFQVTGATEAFATGATHKVL